MLILDNHAFLNPIRSLDLSRFYQRPLTPRSLSSFDISCPCYVDDKTTVGTKTILRSFLWFFAHKKINISISDNGFYLRNIWFINLSFINTFIHWPSYYKLKFYIYDKILNVVHTSISILRKKPGRFRFNISGR